MTLSDLIDLVDEVMDRYHPNHCGPCEYCRLQEIEAKREGL